MTTQPYLPMPEIDDYIETKIEDIAQDMIDRLPYHIHLVYAEYDDKLTDDQITGLIERDPYWDIDMHEWLGDQQFYGMETYRAEARSEWENENQDDDALMDFYYEHEEDILERVADYIYDRDESDPVGDLARNTPDVLLEAKLIDFDARLDTPEDAIDALGLSIEDPSCATSLDWIKEMMTDSDPYYGATVIFAVPATFLLRGDLDDITLKVTNPVIEFGDFTNGFTNVEDAPGYSVSVKMADAVEVGSHGYDPREVFVHNFLTSADVEIDTK